jgi:hypothetical protein
MKYKRMLCWVRPHEKKELEKAVSGQFPLMFAKNYEDFRSNITQDSYLVISLSKARCGEKIFNLIKQFSNNCFYLYQIRPEEINTIPGGKLMFEDNVIMGQYGAEELRDNYLGIIPDLWKMRMNQDFFTIT